MPIAAAVGSLGSTIPDAFIFKALLIYAALLIFTTAHLYRYRSGLGHNYLIYLINVPWGGNLLHNLFWPVMG